MMDSEKREQMKEVIGGLILSPLYNSISLAERSEIIHKLMQNYQGYLTEENGKKQ